MGLYSVFKSRAATWAVKPQLTHVVIPTESKAGHDGKQKNHLYFLFKVLHVCKVFFKKTKTKQPFEIALHEALLT